MTPETRYARTADRTHVAYQVTGDGPIDLLVLRAWHTNLDHEWAEPVLAGIYRRLGSIGRVIRLDRRGSGLSDRVDPLALPTLEDRIDDLRAVMQAAGSTRILPIGLAQAGALCAVFAATHPEQTHGVVLWGPTRDMVGRTDPDDEVSEWEDAIRRAWGTAEQAAAIVQSAGPSRASDAAFIDWLAEDQRQSGTAEEAVALWRLTSETNIDPVLPAIHVPTLVVWREGAAAEGPYVAGRIPGARAVELPGNDHMLIAGDWRAGLDAIERFVEDVVAGDAAADIDRILATVLFTDIVGSTARAVDLGDRGWADLVERHHAVVRRELSRFRGREIDTAGDGFFAVFDGPARAIRCATEIRSRVGDLGLELKIGIHAGECEQEGDALRGLAVHVGARIGAAAAPDEILVSRTIRDLVAGSGLEFEDAGTHRLKGVPDEWPLYRVV